MRRAKIVCTLGPATDTYDQIKALVEGHQAEAVLFDQALSPVQQRNLERHLGVPVADHPEDLGLSGGGAMNEGLVATRLGLKGKPNASEDAQCALDPALDRAIAGALGELNAVEPGTIIGRYRIVRIPHRPAGPADGFVCRPHPTD